VNETLTFPTQGGFISNLDLTCSVSGPASAPSCGISPVSVAAGGTATLTVTAPAFGASVAPAALGLGQAGGMYALCVPFPMLALAFAATLCKRQRKKWWIYALLLAVTTLPAACGGSSPPPPPQRFTVSVTATAATSGAQHTATISVTLR
jgi:hypothetical protein